MGSTLFGVKWRNFKMVLVLQKTLKDPALHLTTPHLINLDADPKELEPYNFPYLHTWSLAHMGKLSSEFQRSLSREPLIPAGAPLDYVPNRNQS
jgi:arylsulfatase